MFSENSFTALIISSFPSPQKNDLRSEAESICGPLFGDICTQDIFPENSETRRTELLSVHVMFAIMPSKFQLTAQ